MAVYAPIWKDTYYTSTASTLSYNITDEDSNIIFSGKAYKMPDADNLKININKICRNYLNNNAGDFWESGADSATNEDACKKFYLTTTEGVALEAYTFLYGYDYDYNWIGSDVTLSNPINNRYVGGMWRPLTKVVSKSVINYKYSGDYTYEVPCADYVLYYLNARGGWDAFVIEGTATKTDKLTQYITDQPFDNTSWEFELNRYVTEIETTYALNTHYLTDEESANLAKNLIGSNKVYLENMIDGTIKPVVITDTSVTYQTYRTNGRKMAQYKINVKESQTKLRR